MRVVLLGPPGVGKGTLADHLKEDFQLVHIATGDMLRTEVKKGSALGLEIKALMDHGALVSDELVTKLVEQKIKHELDLSCGLMFDGFPRTVAQAIDLDRILDDVKSPLDYALSLEANMDILLMRLTGRRICRKCGALFHMRNKPPKVEGVCDFCGGQVYQRADDNAKTIESRMKVYQENTQPIIDYYAKHGTLQRLDSNLESWEVRQMVRDLFKR